MADGGHWLLKSAWPCKRHLHVEWRSVHAVNLIFRAEQHRPFSKPKPTHRADIKKADNR